MDSKSFVIKYRDTYHVVENHDIGTRQVNPNAPGFRRDQKDRVRVVRIVQVNEALSIAHTRLSVQTEKLDPKRVHDLFQHIEHDYKLAEDEDAVAAVPHTREELDQLLDFARVHPLVGRELEPVDGFKLFAEGVELKVGHVRHVLKDVVLVGLAVLGLSHDLTGHLTELVVCVRVANEEGVVRNFAELHEDVGELFVGTGLGLSLQGLGFGLDGGGFDVSFP